MGDKIYTHNELPRKKVSKINGSEYVNFSESVFVLDEFGSIQVLYYDFRMQNWKSEEDGHKVNYTFKWIYKPKWFSW